jgi:hypothetical protein
LPLDILESPICHDELDSEDEMLHNPLPIWQKIFLTAEKTWLEYFTWLKDRSPAATFEPLIDSQFFCEDPQ